MKIALYVCAALVTFITFLAIFAPATIALSFVSVEDVPGLNVGNLDGSIWNAEADIQYQELPASHIATALSVLPLFSGTVHIDAIVTGAGHELALMVTRQKQVISIENLDGHIDATYVNRLARRYGLNFSGELQLRQINLVTDQKWITAAGGSALWNGGKVVLTTAVSYQSFELPALLATLYFEDDQLNLDITHKELKVIRIVLQRDGWAKIELTGRLFQLVNLPQPGNLGLDETILQLEEKIL